MSFLHRYRVAGLGVLLLWVANPAGAQLFKGHHRVIIHEVAWMGTSASTDQIWMELYNPGSETVLLDGWRLFDRDGEFELKLSGRIAPGDSYLLVHKDHPDIPGVPVHATFSGSWRAKHPNLHLHDENGKLVDRVDHWHKGDAATFATMQRSYPYRAGYQYRAWETSRIRYDRGYGSPGFRDHSVASRQWLHAVYHAPDAINVYFNQPAQTKYAQPDNTANHRVNLEERFLSRMRQATQSVDIAIYELNLPDLTDMLIRKAAEGVRVRAVVDTKSPNPEDADRGERWERSRMMLERLARGADGVPGTEDDVILLSNSPIFAFTEDRDRRRAMGLPARPNDFSNVTVTVGNNEIRGHKLFEAARNPAGNDYNPGAQMHNKFIIIDDTWVWTASMNFTLTDLYGEEKDRLRRRLAGNSNNGLEIHSRVLAEIYRSEFEQMWGGAQARPEPDAARFSSRKAQRDEPHQVDVGGTRIDIYFSPGYNVIPAIRETVEHFAREKIYFAVFAWSDYELERIMKVKWEGNDGDLKGRRTGFTIRGVTEFWDDWWSAAANMTGRITRESSDNNPNIRWRHTPPVYRPREFRRLHHKYMIIDAGTGHQPIVITGSANWSNNANNINDENTLIIFSDRVANLYAQDFYGIFKRAGGQLK